MNDADDDDDDDDDEDVAYFVMRCAGGVPDRQADPVTFCRAL